MSRREIGPTFQFAPTNALVVLLLILLSSCATSPSGDVNLRDVLANHQAVEVSATFEEDGLVVLSDVVINGTQMNFILDTGATRSAIFERPYKNLFNSDHVQEQIKVHGISEAEGRPFVKIAALGLGKLTFNDMSLVVLPDRQKSIHYDGLIGMDILEAYSLYFSRRDASLKLIPKDIHIEPPLSWQDIPLYSNPFKEDGRDLHFFDIELSGNKVPVLLDTGAEYNVMNWGLKDNFEFRNIYKKLREDWEYQGAIGEFRPLVKVRSGTFNSNKVVWQSMEFLVMDLDGLKILGIEDNFLVIASMQFFKNDEFLIDFERNTLSVKPEYRVRSLIAPNSYYKGADY